MKPDIVFFFSVPEEHWDEIADYMKSTLEQMDEYYDQLGKNKEKKEEGVKAEADVPEVKINPTHSCYSILITLEWWWNRRA